MLSEKSKARAKPNSDAHEFQAISSFQSHLHSCLHVYFDCDADQNTVEQQHTVQESLSLPQKTKKKSLLPLQINAKNQNKHVKIEEKVKPRHNRKEI
jgi:hypothetical protein